MLENVAALKTYFKLNFFLYYRDGSSASINMLSIGSCCYS